MLGEVVEYVVCTVGRAALVAYSACCKCLQRQRRTGVPPEDHGWHMV